VICLLVFSPLCQFSAWLIRPWLICPLPDSPPGLVVDVYHVQKRVDQATEMDEERLGEVRKRRRRQGDMHIQLTDQQGETRNADIVKTEK